MKKNKQSLNVSIETHRRMLAASEIEGMKLGRFASKILDEWLDEYFKTHQISDELKAKIDAKYNK